ncbi:MAG: cupin domain-containing protein [Candidatus Dormibacteraceae bacterium]
MDAGEIIENRSSGERIVIRQSGRDTNGALLSFDLFLAPGASVPSGHVHPQQEERFQLIEGRVRFRVGTKMTILEPGDAVTIPCRTAHRFANAGERRAHLLVEVRPALQMEAMLRTAAALSRGGRRPLADLPRPHDLALFLREFKREVQAPFLPPTPTLAVVRAIAWLVARLGLDGHYRRTRESGK